MKCVAAYQRGEREGFITHVPAKVDVRAIRNQRGQTQDVFARTYGFSVAPSATGNKAAASPNAPREFCWR